MGDIEAFTLRVQQLSLAAISGHRPLVYLGSNWLPAIASFNRSMNRPACSQAFDEQPHLQLLKEILTHAFATPRRHHKSKPFCDRVLAFSVADSRIWLRNYQARFRLFPCASFGVRPARYAPEMCWS